MYSGVLTISSVIFKQLHQRTLRLHRKVVTARNINYNASSKSYCFPDQISGLFGQASTVGGLKHIKYVNPAVGSILTFTENCHSDCF